MSPLPAPPPPSPSLCYLPLPILGVKIDVYIFFSEKSWYGTVTWMETRVRTWPWPYTTCNMHSLQWQNLVSDAYFHHTTYYVLSWCRIHSWLERVSIKWASHFITNRTKVEIWPWTRDLHKRYVLDPRARGLDLWNQTGPAVQLQANVL